MTRLGFIIAGVVYISGIFGMEMIGGNYASIYGEENFTYQMLNQLEECLEIIAIAIFIPTLLSYLKNEMHIKSLQLLYQHNNDHL